jgi:uncharacterized protein
MGDERDPGLPIKLEPCSNSEFVPPPPSALVRETVRRARQMSEERALKLGMPRREFLLSSMGAATTLAALAACSNDASNGENGGTFDIPEEATIDPDAALEVLGSDQPVIDVQTHFLDDSPDVADLSGLFINLRDDCDEDDPRACFTTERWIEEVFGRSDTTMAVLSALPIPEGADPLSAEIMDAARRQLEELCDNEHRVLVQGHAQPNQGELQAHFDAMEEEAERYPIVAWKTYTHAGAGWSLDDSITDESLSQPLGEAFLAKVEEMHAGGRGPNIVCVHKGLNLGLNDNPIYHQANDVGPAAAAHPDLRFCIYHSGFESSVSEGPYDPDAPNDGIDLLIESLEDAGVGPGGNVYAELGATWRAVMQDPDTAAHVLGKLLLAVGEDRILWGTDSIWFGSPQDQIQALRTFQISEEYQERYGYPALTEEIKAKIFWRNAAQLHGIDAYRLTCDAAAVDPAERDEARRATRLANRTYGPKTAELSRRVFLSAHPWAASPGSTV